MKKNYLSNLNGIELDANGRVVISDDVLLKEIRGAMLAAPMPVALDAACNSNADCSNTQCRGS